MYLELDAYIDQRRDTPFGWLQHDCVHFAAGWVHLMTGRDPLGDLAGMPRSVRAQLRVIHAAGGFEAAATARLGPCLPGLLAQRGDVALVASGRRAGRVSGHAFALCTGEHLVLPGLAGLQFLPVTMSETAWRVA